MGYDDSRYREARRSVDVLVNALLGGTAAASRLLEREKREQHEAALERAFRGEFDDIVPGTLGLTFRQEQQKALSLVKGENDAREFWNTLQPAAQEKQTELMNDETLTPATRAEAMRQWLRGEINKTVSIKDDDYYKSSKLRQMYNYGNNLQDQFMGNILKADIQDRKVTLGQFYNTNYKDWWASNKAGNPQDGAEYFVNNYHRLMDDVKKQVLPKTAAYEIAGTIAMSLVASGDENAPIVLRQLRDMDSGDGKDFGTLGIVTDKHIDAAERNALDKLTQGHEKQRIERGNLTDSLNQRMFQAMDALKQNPLGDERDQLLSEIQELKSLALNGDLSAQQRSQLVPFIDSIEAKSKGEAFPDITDDRARAINLALRAGKREEAARLFSENPYVSLENHFSQKDQEEIMRAVAGLEETKERAAVSAMTLEIGRQADLGAMIDKANMSKQEIDLLFANGSNQQREMEHRANMIIKQHLDTLWSRGIDPSSEDGRKQLQKMLEDDPDFIFKKSGGGENTGSLFDKRKQYVQNLDTELNERSNPITANEAEKYAKVIADANEGDRNQIRKKIESKCIDPSVADLISERAAAAIEKQKADPGTNSNPEDNITMNSPGEVKAYLGDTAKAMPHVYLGDRAESFVKQRGVVNREGRQVITDMKNINPKDKLLTPVISSDWNYLLRDGKSGYKIVTGKDMDVADFTSIDLREPNPEINPAKPYYNQSARGEFDTNSIRRNPNIDQRLYLDYSNDQLPMKDHYIIISDNGNIKKVKASQFTSRLGRATLTPPFDPGRMLAVKRGDKYTAMSLEDIYMEVFTGGREGMGVVDKVKDAFALRRKGEYSMGDIQILSERPLDQMGAEERQRIINGGVIRGD